eukprot:SAG11_NODE_1942_length_4022_cov_2.900841_3_plen_45_part_00
MGTRPASVGTAKMEASHGLGTVAQVQWRLEQLPLDHVQICPAYI